MQQAILLLIVVLISSCSWLSATVVGTSVPAESLTIERISSLPKDQAAVWKAYLERSAQQMKADKAVLAAELKKAGLTVPLIPPDQTNSRILTLNRPPEWYRGAEARRIADIVVSFQTPAGGWSKNLDLTDHVRRVGEHFASDTRGENRTLLEGDGDFTVPQGWDYVGTIDNDATICELEFLAKVVSALDPKTAAPYRASFLRGVEYLFAAQYPNGGWPQVWPLQGEYHDAITFNDNAMIQVMEVLEGVATGGDSYQFVPQDVRARARASVQRGLQCILAAQIVKDGRRTVWGQQHDALTLRPVVARNYEPASECSAESTRLVMYLMKRPQPGPEIIRAVDAAIAWLRKAALHDVAWSRRETSLKAVEGAGPLWARYYDIASERPIFGDRDKSIHDRAEELSRERRTSYAWYTSMPSQALTAYDRWKSAQSSK